MYEKDLVVDILKNLLSAIQQVLKRFEPIQAAGDFVKDDAGREKLDSICMQLIAIGEELKQIDKLTEGTLFSGYPAVDWKKAMVSKYAELAASFTEKWKEGKKTNRNMF